MSVFELFPDEGWLPRHYGNVARAVWRLVDEVFKPADVLADCPPGFKSKSVQVADIYEAGWGRVSPLDTNGRPVNRRLPIAEWKIRPAGLSTT